MALDSNAIAIGPGTLYVAPIGTSDPTNASSALPSAWRQVGYTEEGSVFSYAYETEEVFVAETTEAVRVDTTKTTGTVSFSMAEMTRENLALALNLGANAANDASLIEPPDLGSELRIKLVLDSLGGSRWIFRKCVNGGTIEIARKKAPDKSLIPVEFKLEKPTGAKSFGVYPAASGYLT